MNPFLGIALFVGIYAAAHLYGCPKCRTQVRDWHDDLDRFVRSIRRSR